MRALAAIAALSFLAGCATVPFTESDIPGLYALVSVDDRSEPGDEASAWLLEMTPRGTWHMFSEDRPWLFDEDRAPWEGVPGPSRNRGWYSVEGKKDGCTLLSFTFAADPEYVFHGNSFDGELTLADFVRPPYTFSFYAPAGLRGLPEPAGFPYEGRNPVTEVYRKRR
jgi:hypothetical protein